MLSADFHEECPINPNERTCGIAAARWLVRNDSVFIAVEPIDPGIKALDAQLEETPGVLWDSDSTGDALELVDQTAVGERSTFANATFGCLACSKWVRISLEPFNSFGIEIVEP